VTVTLVRRSLTVGLLVLSAVGVYAASGDERAVVVDANMSVGPDGELQTVIASWQPGDQLPPVASDTVSTSTAWYCPGVPLGGAGYDGNDYGGEAVVANPTDTEITGVVTRYLTDQEAQTSLITVPPRDRVVVDLDAGIDGAYVSAVVELAGVNGGGGAVVEQRAVHPAGDSVQPCANQPSPEWFFADGFTASDSVEDLLLTNPLADATVINVRFVTNEGEREPSPLQGYVLPPRSLRVLKIAEQGARGEQLVGVEIRAQSGAFVAGRAQHYLGTGRLGYTVKLGAPATSKEWWVISGNYAGKPAEQIDVFNPGKTDAVVTVLFTGGDAAKVAPLTLIVPAHRVVNVSMANVAGLPEAPFALSLSVLDGEGIVVEHVVTRQLADNAATSIDLAFPGVMARTQWRGGIGLPGGTENGLLLFNVTAVGARASISSVGPAGLQTVPGLESVELASGQPTYVKIPDGIDVGQLGVSADQPILVSRLIPRTAGVGGRDLVPALPVMDAVAAGQANNETEGEPTP
jgi:hypothetical protein